MAPKAFGKKMNSRGKILIDFPCFFFSPHGKDSEWTPQVQVTLRDQTVIPDISSHSTWFRPSDLIMIENEYPDVVTGMIVCLRV